MSGFTATCRPFGRLPDGREVAAVTLAGDGGTSATLIAWGASVQAMLLPDRAGRLADVALGHATIDEYLARRRYFGSTCGRYANRIADGRFTLDGRSYAVPPNDGGNALHGGPSGFDQALWAVTDVRSGDAASVTMRHVSPDGDQGFPGALTVEVIYRLDRDGLTIDHRAATDRATVVGLTNHAYWNLAGEGSAEDLTDHLLTVPAAQFLPTDAAAIPTGERRAVAGTPFDFLAPRRIGDRVDDAADGQIAFGQGYDHCFVLGDGITAELRPMARLVDPASGRGFDLLSNQPGLQVYSGNFLDGTSCGKAGRPYRRRAGIALEPQLFPDTPNRPAFGSARLAPGEAYRNLIAYRFFVAG